MDAVVAAHIAAKERLQVLAALAATSAWDRLPSYDRANIDEFLSTALPLLAGANLQSVTLTEAYLAHALGRQPLGVDAPAIAAGIRNGATSEEVYKRPFVTVWAALGRGTPFDDAVRAGRERAASTAATDVQLAFSHTLRDVGAADDLILGYQRVPDAGACDFCQLVAGQRYTTEDLLPIHNRCACGVDVITGEHRPDFTGRYDQDPVVARTDDLAVAVREHGELGPVLVNADQHFTPESQLAA